MVVSIDWKWLASQFDIEGQPEACIPLGNGQINDTFLLSTGRQKYVLQKINTQVFPEPEKIMENVNRVLNHIKGPVQLILGRDGQLGVPFSEGYWRLYQYVPNTVSLDVVEKPAHASKAAEGFGDFVYQLSNLDPKLIHPVLPRFHDVHWRLDQLKTAIEGNRVNRWQSVEGPLEELMGHSDRVVQLYDQIKNGPYSIPLRITHNDTKISNVLLDKKTMNPVAVVDLDLIMPGYVLFDLGDMIRTFLSPADENEKDISKIEIREPVLKSLARGYAKGSRGILTDIEKETVLDGGIMVIFMQAARFAADFLNGDQYYKILYNTHNQVRFINQLTLLNRILEKENLYRELIAESMR
jgi:aminoglycoside phosphotransferase (APT) family kinase protein